MKMIRCRQAAGQGLNGGFVGKLGYFFIVSDNSRVYSRSDSTSWLLSGREGQGEEEETCRLRGRADGVSASGYFVPDAGGDDFN